MTRTVPTTLPVVADRDGLAVIGRTRHDLMGIRYNGDTGGNAPAGQGGVTPGAAAATGAEQTPPAGTQATEATTSTTTADTEAQDVASLPAWAQKVITDTRAEAARYRTGSETAAKTAAEKAQQELVDKIAIAAGLKQAEAQDPAKLAAAVQQAQDAAKATERRLAVFTAAADTAQANALLNRLDFTNSIAGLDPSDGPAFQAAVKAALDADPSLKTTRAVGTSTVTPEAGSPESGPITEAQLAQMTPEQIEKAYREGRLKNLLG
ncbi:hypothetical protein HP467_07265 [Curtobacterium albidum]|uniref:Scaffolding protein n=1 Tax=Curtobacterium citreum TaxID=2036 RepID=A0A850DUT2_9MICO|nr:hypothetical protein [Curtobacterium albidum]NUU27910.1 hypothetical protein [Curtobacterium albidum]